MSFKDLDKILEIVTQQPQFEAYRQYCQLLKCWRSVVSASVVDRTRPLYISRQVLWVATASAVLAQELSLQRYALLKKLNTLLPEKLEDIRFSSAQWNSQALGASKLISVADDKTAHPSHFEEMLEPEGLQTDPQQSFDRWVERIRQRSQSLPLCPLCQSPTPPGEIERWSCCTFCAAQNPHSLA